MVAIGDDSVGTGGDATRSTEGEEEEKSRNSARQPWSTGPSSTTSSSTRVSEATESGGRGIEEEEVSNDRMVAQGEEKAKDGSCWRLEGILKSLGGDQDRSNSSTFQTGRRNVRRRGVDGRDDALEDEMEGRGEVGHNEETGPFEDGRRGVLLKSIRGCRT